MDYSFLLPKDNQIPKPSDKNKKYFLRFHIFSTFPLPHAVSKDYFRTFERLNQLIYQQKVLQQGGRGI